MKTMLVVGIFPLPRKEKGDSQIMHRIETIMASPRHRKVILKQSTDSGSDVDGHQGHGKEEAIS